MTKIDRPDNCQYLQVQHRMILIGTDSRSLSGTSGNAAIRSQSSPLVDPLYAKLQGLGTADLVEPVKVGKSVTGS